jgi:hypothetical protein
VASITDVAARLPVSSGIETGVNYLQRNRRTSARGNRAGHVLTST